MESNQNLNLTEEQRTAIEKRCLCPLRPDNFVTVSGWMIRDLGLSGGSLVIFALIYGFSQDGKSWFSGSQTYAGAWAGVSRRQAISIFNSLEESGLIIKRTEKRSGRSVNLYRADLDLIQSVLDSHAEEEQQYISSGQNELLCNLPNVGMRCEISSHHKKSTQDAGSQCAKTSPCDVQLLHTPCEETAPDAVKKLPRFCEETAHNNIENITVDNIEDKTKELLPEKEIWQRWKEVMDLVAERMDLSPTQRKVWLDNFRFTGIKDSSLMVRMTAANGNDSAKDLLKKRYGDAICMAVEEMFSVSLNINFL